MTDPIRVKADLIPYVPEYSRVVHSWIDSEETYLDLCRGKQFPPPEDIVDSWQRDGVTSFVMLSERKPVAYGELWHRPTDLALEIAHLIVDRYRRSEGFGTKMTELLYDRASQRENITRVMIHLYGENEVALGCYLKAGFELLGTTTYTTGLRLVRPID